MLSVVRIGFDPTLTLAGYAARWQTLGIAAAVVIALVLAALIAGRVRRPGQIEGSAGTFQYGEAAAREGRHLRRDDLLLLALGLLAGAVVGGRLAHALAFWDVYQTAPETIYDTSRGSLSLLGAVLGATVFGVYLTSLLDRAAGRWADVAAVPMLVALCLGKLAQFVGGSGQGAPLDGPWAVAFTGRGPWGSIEPAVPAHPSQLYEAGWSLLGIVVVLGALMMTRGRGSGRLFVIALAWWLVGRVLIGSTWRDDRVFASLNAEQVMAAGALVLIAVGLFIAGSVRLARRVRGLRRSDRVVHAESSRAPERGGP